MKLRHQRVRIIPERLRRVVFKVVTSYALRQMAARKRARNNERFVKSPEFVNRMFGRVEYPSRRRKVDAKRFNDLMQGVQK